MTAERKKRSRKQHSRIRLQRLKPCPFCGGRAKVRFEVAAAGWPSWSVGHDTLRCLMQPLATANFRCEAEAREAWNTRAPR